MLIWFLWVCACVGAFALIWLLGVMVFVVGCLCLVLIDCLRGLVVICFNSVG